jgi:hypothetical protein
MSKRKSAKRSKLARPTSAARAHVKKQAIVKSARDSLLGSVAVGPIESPLELHDDSKREAPPNEKIEAPNSEKKGASDAGKTVEDGSNQTVGYDLALATGNMAAYQAKLIEAYHVKLIELTQANAQFAFDLGFRLATIRSPFQFAEVIVELATRSADMWRKQAAVMAALRKR